MSNYSKHAQLEKRHSYMDLIISPKGGGDPCKTNWLERHFSVTVLRFLLSQWLCRRWSSRVPQGIPLLQTSPSPHGDSPRRFRCHVWSPHTPIYRGSRSFPWHWLRWSLVLFKKNPHFFKMSPFFLKPFCLSHFLFIHIWISLINILKTEV